MAQYIFFVNKQTKTCLQGVWHLPDNLDAFPSQAQKRTKLPEKWYGCVRQRLAEQLHVSIVCRWQKHSVIALILTSSRDTKQHSEEQDELRFWSAHERFPLIAPSSRCEEDSSDSWRISTLPLRSPPLPLLLYNSPSTLSVAICARIKWRISDSSSSLARHQIPPHTFAVKRRCWRWRIIRDENNLVLIEWVLRILIKYFRPTRPLQSCRETQSALLATCDSFLLPSVQSDKKLSLCVEYHVNANNVPLSPDQSGSGISSYILLSDFANNYTLQQFPRPRIYWAKKTAWTFGRRAWN